MLIISLIIALLAHAPSTEVVYSDPVTFCQTQSSVVFRSTQKLKDPKSGWEFYLYTNREWIRYDSNGNAIQSGTYTIADGEVYFYNTNNKLMFKGSFQKRGADIRVLYLQGAEYVKK